jgi:DNA-binding response OmpR family regulator
MKSSKLNVLVVDDSHDMLDLLRRNLNEMNINPFASDSVVNAIEIIENSQLDLVITDLKMPGIGGVQLVRYIAQHYPELPVLVISGYPNVESAVEVMKLGALEYLVKPFTFEELETTIHSVLNQKGIKQNDPLLKSDEKEIYQGLKAENIGVDIISDIELIDNYKIVFLSKKESEIETIQDLRKHLLSKGGHILLDHLFYYKSFYKVSGQFYECHSLYIDDFLKRFHEKNMLFNLKNFKILINDYMGSISMYEKKTFKSIKEML